MIKPGKNDIRVNLKFEIDELELLQENSWQMSESFGLDRRIDRLTGKRKVGFYMWDLECLEMVVSDLKKTEKNKQLSENLYNKIRNAMEFINNQKNNP